MQNRECIVFERTRVTEQSIHEPVPVCESRAHPVFNQSPRMKFAKFQDYFKNKPQAEVLKIKDIILCLQKLNTIQLQVFNLFFF